MSKQGKIAKLDKLLPICCISNREKGFLVSDHQSCCADDDDGDDNDDDDDDDDDDNEDDERERVLVSDHQMCCELSGFPESPDWLFDSGRIRRG